MADVTGDRNTWDAARELGKQLKIPVGPYEPRVPTADEMNAVLPYILDRMAKFAADKYYCENAELTMAHVLGINTPRQGFPTADGFNPRTGLDWEGYNRDGFDAGGFNRQGFNRRGFNREGRDAEGYNLYGYDQHGFDRNGRDDRGRTREEVAVEQVTQWSPQHLAAIRAKLIELGLDAPAPKVEAEAADVIKLTKKTATQKAKPVRRRLVVATA